MTSFRLDIDRSCDAALRMLAALVTLAFASFVVILFAGTWAARAEAICTGTDLLAGMARDRPDVYRETLEASERTINGETMLWRVETPSGAISHLYGTMHVADPRVTQLPEPAQAAWNGSETLAIETTDILDPAAMMTAMAAHPELMMFTDGTTLSSLLADDAKAMVQNVLAERGLSLAAVDRMKPWMIAALVTLPACELARKAAGAEILDVALATRARAAGMAVEGLETTTEQLQAMAALPLDFHVRSLVETLGLGDMIDDVFETMVVIHARGAPGLFHPFFEAVLPDTEANGVLLSGFEETVINARNHKMAERMKPLIDEGSAFIAIGALHLPGEEGVVALLQASGYSIDAVSIAR